jgi:hypothetical protein
MTLQMHPDRRWWRIGGGLVVAHVVLALVSAAAEQTPQLRASVGTREAALVHRSMTTVFAGGYLEFVGMLVFLAAALLMAQLLRGAGVLPGWLASCIGAAALTATAITLAGGSAAGAAAVYQGHHGVDLDILTTANDVRNFAFYLFAGVLGVFALAVAGAVRATGTLPRWLSHTGFVVGAVCLVAPALQAWDTVNFAMLLWYVWFLALGVVALRGPRSVVLPAEQPAGATV